MLVQQARLMTKVGSFWGPAPGSNRWADLVFWNSDMAEVIAPGEAVQFAINQGWLVAERHREPGIVLENDPEGGELECRWRYSPVNKPLAPGGDGC
jgi:hypothetical protein